MRSGRWVLGVALLLAGCGPGRSAVRTSDVNDPSTTAAPITATSQATTSTIDATTTTTAQANPLTTQPTAGGPPTSARPTPSRIYYHSVGLSIPAGWPVIDGANFTLGCSTTFFGQADRAYLGPTYHGAPSCGARTPGQSPEAADGMWMQPGQPSPPDEAATTLPGGQVVYMTSDASASDVSVWYHDVSINIGIGANPAVQRAILDSISYNPGTPDTPVLGRCPAPDPEPPVMPAPARITAAVAVDADDGTMLPEPDTVEPKVSARTVWNSLFHEVGSDGFPGPIKWSIYFGSYSAQTPATMNPDGSTTPVYQGVPTWLIEGESAHTAYGACGITVVAPFNADSGQGMGVLTTG